MSDDEGTELTTTKEECSFLELPPNLTDVTWKEDLYPIEVHLTGDINSDSVCELETSFREAQRSGQTTIPVVIQSGGGDMYDALKIVDLILTSPIEVITIVRGYAMSAAVMIFSCGSRRIIGPHASLMIHPVSTTYFQGRCKDMKVETKEIERLQDLYCQIMSENTGKAIKFFKERLEKNHDVYMSPDEAKECGIATDIGDGRLVTKVSVSTTLEFVPYNKKRRRVRR